MITNMINNIEKGKTYLVTGGSGFLGRCLIGRILKEGGKVKTIARDEGKLSYIIKTSSP